MTLEGELYFICRRLQRLSGDEDEGGTEADSGVVCVCVCRCVIEEAPCAFFGSFSARFDLGLLCLRLYAARRPTHDWRKREREWKEKAGKRDFADCQYKPVPATFLRVDRPRIEIQSLADHASGHREDFEPIDAAAIGVKTILMITRRHHD